MVNDKCEYQRCSNLGVCYYHDTFYRYDPYTIVSINYFTACEKHRTYYSSLIEISANEYVCGMVTEL